MLPFVLFRTLVIDQYSTELQTYVLVWHSTAAKKRGEPGVQGNGWPSAVNRVATIYDLVCSDPNYKRDIIQVKFKKYDNMTATQSDPLVMCIILLGHDSKAG